ncbi:MAG: FAD-binding protein, partial [Myxococcota bacterium]|nr:FAD-binding protein [Myxococcota bacterium]
VPYETSTMPMPGASLSYTGSERAYPYREIARPAPRGHTVQKDGVGSGEYLMQILVEQFERSGGEIQPNTRSETLVVDSEGRVVGVVARVGSDPCLVRARRGVVLTTGGFIQNPEMLRWYAPEVLQCGRPIAAETSDDGSGIRMGIGAGGAAVRMDSACIVLGFAYGNRDNIRGILVNAQGQRYVNEDVYQSNHGEIALKRQQGEVYLIVDDSIYQAPSDDPSLAGVLYPLLAAGETPSELESELGMPPGSLQHTLEVYNENAAKGEDPYFKKEACWVRPLKPPYAALDLRVGNSPYSVFTLGGLHTRVGGEVLDAEGAVVPGLYAAGRTASGVPAQGYNSGLSIADCTFTGRLAGASAAAASAD